MGGGCEGGEIRENLPVGSSSTSSDTVLGIRFTQTFPNLSPPALEKTSRSIDIIVDAVSCTQTTDIPGVVVNHCCARGPPWSDIICKDKQSIFRRLIDGVGYTVLCVANHESRALC